MSTNRSRLLARLMLKFFNVQYSIHYAKRIPLDGSVIVISNHRSFLDAPLLLESMPYSLRIACHSFMGQAPGLKQFVSWLGCFPIAASNQRQQYLFHKAQTTMNSRQWLGIFPEGALPMVEYSSHNRVGKFQRGFAHVAYRLKVDNLMILPIAIASLNETQYQAFPIKWLTKLDPLEPLFQREGRHPVIVYNRVKLIIGRPYRINLKEKQNYRGKQAKQLVHDLTNSCQQQITELLREGCTKKGVH